MDGLIQWQTGTNLLGYAIDNAHGERITGLFRDEQILGHFLAHVVPLSFALLLFLVKDKKNYLNALLLFSFLILSEVFIFITNDRSAFIKIVQFTLLLIFTSNNFKLFRLISFFISLVIISWLALNTSHSHNRYMKNTLEEVSSTKIPYMPWTPMHDKHFEVAFNFFQESPIIGKGPQFFRYKCLQDSIKGCINHPHNYYFQTLAELGVIGVSFLFLGFLYLSFILFRQFLNVWILKKEKYHIPDHLLSLYSLTFIFLWPLIPNGSFYNNWLNVMIFLPVPFIFYFRSMKNK
jgi:O-antigen ligase